MMQFYLLSVVLNALTGYILISAEGGIPEIKSGFPLKDETCRLIVGILSIFTGIIKILSVVEGDVRVIGDLLPALTGIIAGFTLVFEYYKNRSTFDATEQTQKIERALVSNRKLIGTAAIIAAILHFVFPKVLLL